MTAPKIKYLLIIILNFAGIIAHGQLKQVVLDLPTGHDPVVAKIAINPRDPKNAVVLASSQSIFYTADAGATWTKSIVTTPEGSTSPTIAAGNKGAFYYFLSIPGKIVCYSSGDAGRSWVETGVVNTDPKKTNVKLLASVDDKENLYLTWVQFDAFPSQDNSCTSVVQFSRSSNGKKWSSPTRLNQDAGNCLDGDNSPSKAFPAISSDERVFSAWSINGRIFLDRSYDGGSTWLSNDIGITNQPGGKNFDIPGLDKYEASPSIILDRSRSQYQGFLYLAWADQHSGQNDTDVWFIRSNNGGDNWTSVLRVNDDDPGKHQYAPTLAMDYSTGIVYVAYFDRRAYEDNQTDVYVAYSMDGGTSFNNVKVTSAPFIADQTLLNSLSMTAMKSTLAITWSQSDGTSPRLLTIVLKHDELVIEGDKQKK